MTKDQWIHLAKLLSAHYATEKAPWTKDLTTDLLRVYMGLQDCCEQEVFKDILFRMVTGTLRIALKKITAANQQISLHELTKVLNYMFNVYLLDNNNKYFDYILELMKVMEMEDSEQEFSDLKGWINEHMEKAVE